MKSLLPSLTIAAALCTAAPALAAPPATGGPMLVIEDNDFAGPATSNIQSVVPLLAAPGVRLLGFTVVTGDAWRDEETQFLLRFLEIAGRPDIPVVQGAVDPLVNTRARMLAWQATNGQIPWKGAWSDPVPGASFHPTDSRLLPPIAEGPPKITATPGTAAAFLIEQIHRHPGQVTIVANGPLTNLALALRLDPDFARLTKQLVIMGAATIGIDGGGAQPENIYDFNFMFDPEAAHMVLNAAWPQVTVVGDVALSTNNSPEFVKRIGAKHSAVADYLVKHAEEMPLWDELASAVAVDPSLITKSVDVYLDVDIDHGAHYGMVRAWTEKTRPKLGEQLVRVVQAVDVKRFEQQFIDAAQALPAVKGRN